VFQRQYFVRVLRVLFSWGKAMLAVAIFAAFASAVFVGAVIAVWRLMGRDDRRELESA
jgi:hypothetical protein